MSTTGYPNNSSSYVPPACAASGGYIYCVGGDSGSPLSVNNEAYYAPISGAGVGAWTKTTSDPGGEVDPSCFVSESDLSVSYLYCVGGDDGIGVEQTSGVFYAPVSSTGIGTWQNTTSYPVDITGASCVTSGLFAYCAGGQSYGSAHYDNATYYATFYGVGGVIRWTPTTSYPGSVRPSECVSTNVYIYCIGGFNWATGESTDAVYYAHLSTGGIGAWSSTAAYPGGPGYPNSYGCVATSIDVYCVGGDGSTNTPVYYAHVQSSPQVTNVLVGSDPMYVAIDSKTNTVYVSNTGDGTVSAINGATNAVAATISVGTIPMGIAVDPNTDMVYVANGGGYVSVIDGSTNNVVSTINATGYAPFGVGVNPNTNTVYVSSNGLKCDCVLVINGATNTVTTVIPITAPGQYNTHTIAVDPNTNMVYVAGDGFTYPPADDLGTLTIINGTTNTETGYLVLGSGGYDVAVNPATNTIYFSSFGCIYVINAATNGLETRINGTGSGFQGVAVDPSTNTLYATDGGILVYTISGATNMITQSVSTGAGYTNYVAVNPVTGTYYVSESDPGDGNSGSNAVSVITPGVGAAVSTLTVNAQDTNGNPLPGYEAVLNQSGTIIVARGYTPATFNLTQGQSYTVTVDGYGSCTFDKWLDTGNSSAIKQISITSNTQITAILSCAMTTTSSSSTSTSATSSMISSSSSSSSVTLSSQSNLTSSTSSSPPSSTTATTYSTFSSTSQPSTGPSDTVITSITTSLDASSSVSSSASSSPSSASSVSPSYLLLIAMVTALILLIGLLSRRNTGRPTDGTADHP